MGAAFLRSILCALWCARGGCNSFHSALWISFPHVGELAVLLPLFRCAFPRQRSTMVGASRARPSCDPRGAVLAPVPSFLRAFESAQTSRRGAGKHCSAHRFGKCCKSRNRGHDSCGSGISRPLLCRPCDLASLCSTVSCRRYTGGTSRWL